MPNIILQAQFRSYTRPQGTKLKLNARAFRRARLLETIMSVANLGKTTHLNYSGKVSMKRLIGKDFYGKAEKVPKL